MAESSSRRSIDPITGFCHLTRTFHSLRPQVPLPPPSHPLSLPQYTLSLLRSSTASDGDTTFIINATNGQSLSYSEFIAQFLSLAQSLKKNYSLSPNDVAFILSPPSLHVPVLYFALMSLGIVISPANPLSSDSEIAHQLQLTKPVIAFATSKTSSKLPSLKLGTIILDSPEFISFFCGKGYGLTETGGGGARVVSPEEAARYGTVGRLAENTEAKIVDLVTGEALAPGQRGELWLRGPTVMKGYVGNEKETAETVDSEGWLKTGDICYFDSEGFLYIVDRLKELIKYKAYQVPPAELEHLLHSHPEIADAAVISYPDEEAGQIPMAYVVRKPGSSITEAQVIDYIANQVAPYKKIRRVAFIDLIPKSPAGKILRRELINHSLSKL